MEKVAEWTNFTPLTDFIHRLDQLQRTRREAGGFPTGPRDPEKLNKVIKESSHESDKKQEASGA